MKGQFNISLYLKNTMLHKYGKFSGTVLPWKTNGCIGLAFRFRFSTSVKVDGLFKGRLTNVC